MSNFQTFAQVTEGLPGTAPNIFVASTTDNLGAITAAGYMNDLKAKIKQNDVIYINYSDTSTFPLNTGELSTLGEFMVNYSSPNWSIASVLTGLGTAAAKAATNNALASLASVTAQTYTIGDVLTAADSAGTIQDSGLNVANLPQFVSINLTAAQFNALYATPIEVLAAPGAGNMIVVDKALLIQTYGTTQFTLGGALALQYEATVHGAGVPASASIAASSINAATASIVYEMTAVASIVFAAAENEPVYISNATQDFATGDSTFTLNMYYRVVAV